jgi:exosortase C (VPDSG-CTERM-specific)
MPFWIASGVLLLAFAWPLWALARFSLRSDLYSHIVLIPAVSIYFVWLQRKALPPVTSPDRLVALIAGVIGVGLVGWHLALRASGATLTAPDVHAFNALSFLTFLVAVCAWWLGRSRLVAVAFPLGFLIFLSPIPTAVVGIIETFLQYGSASVAYALLKAVGTPVFRDDLTFVLPGFSMKVAPQCSGIHSSLALFITSVAAGYLFLQRPWKRIVLALAVIPLALVRNGFRVFVIGELCVRISPDMINSWVHKQGGPFFFALSLIPFSILLFFLYRSDRRAAGTPLSANRRLS